MAKALEAAHTMTAVEAALRAHGVAFERRRVSADPALLKTFPPAAAGLLDGEPFLVFRDDAPSYVYKLESATK
ncbi:hypothetical protein [Sphingomonas sp. ID0503]|uniref:hypothetical protein n=1 Tax=Sphingomonas sp. ID0503 TaxID=3399691 RepID=UPI003AFB6511